MVLITVQGVLSLTLPIQVELLITGSASGIFAVSICPGRSISIAMFLSWPVFDCPRQVSFLWSTYGVRHHWRWSSSATSGLHDLSWWLHWCNSGNPAWNIPWCITWTSVYSTVAGSGTTSWMQMLGGLSSLAHPTSSILLSYECHLYPKWNSSPLWTHSACHLNGTSFLVNLVKETAIWLYPLMNRW